MGFFLFDKGRFPGSQELVMLPQPKIPDFFRTQIALSPIDLYKKISSTNAKALASIQALVALNFYIGGDLLEQFVKIEQELYKDSETLDKNLDKTINETDLDIEVAPEVEIKEDVLKFHSGEKKLPPEPKIKTMLLTTNEIEKIMKTNKNNILKLPLHLIKQILTQPLKMQKKVRKEQY